MKWQTRLSHGAPADFHENHDSAEKTKNSPPSREEREEI
jgi:hypothetical protein